MASQLEQVQKSMAAQQRGAASPASLNAHAYAAGSDIHLAPEAAATVPHEASHVAQQGGAPLAAIQDAVGHLAG